MYIYPTLTSLDRHGRELGAALQHVPHREDVVHIGALLLVHHELTAVFFGGVVVCVIVLGFWCGEMYVNYWVWRHRYLLVLVRF